MHQPLFKKLLRRRSQQLNRYGKRLEAGFDAEAIHRFRVAFKQMRALVHLGSFGEAVGRFFRMGGRVHGLYHLLGEIRSIQLQKEAVRATCRQLALTEPEEYLVDLQQKEEALKERIAKHHVPTRFPRLRRRMKKLSRRPPGQPVVAGFITTQFLELTLLLCAEKLSEEQLHQVRKLLKDILYTWPLTATAVGWLLPDKTLFVKACRSLTEQLGTYNDLCVIVDFLNADMEAPWSGEEQATLEAIRCYCQSRLAKCRAEAVARLHLLRHWLVQHHGNTASGVNG
jgi:CHAD domain-containing protein